MTSIGYDPITTNLLFDFLHKASDSPFFVGLVLLSSIASIGCIGWLLWEVGRVVLPWAWGQM